MDDSSASGPPSVVAPPSNLNQSRNRRHRPRKGPNRGVSGSEHGIGYGGGVEQGTSSGNQPPVTQIAPKPNHRRRNKPPVPHPSSPTNDADTPSASAPQKQRRQPPDPGASRSATPNVKERKRRAPFNNTLTDSVAQPENSRPPAAHVKKAHLKKPAGDDLTSKLIYTLSTPPYADCPICFAAIHPAQPVWSCLPSVNDGPSCCYTPFHLKCVRSWAAKSVKDIEAAYAARGEGGKSGEWRCPGCQKRREEVPARYQCFCGSVASPQRTQLATPHSCGNSCSRPRSAHQNPTNGDDPACTHPCPLLCHPGPCPPCQVTIHMRCHCGKDEKTFKCRQLAKAAEATDVRCCEQKCAKSLNCGKHQCPRICHPGPCLPCDIKVTKRCWCGRKTKEEICGENMSERYACTNTCAKVYLCGVHSCERACHPEHLDSSGREICPYDPSVLRHCPCGKVELTSLSLPLLSPAFQSSCLPRTSCSDPVPTCTSQCLKNLPCSHQCQVPCHLRDCPPCQELVERSCRCGGTRKHIPCSQLYDPQTGVELEVLCDKPCGAFRACGKHECKRICCPLAGFAMGQGKTKGRRRGVVNQGDTELDLAAIGGLHECDLICGKPLPCGNHKCEVRDHRGACPPCLRSSFNEIVCHCGRTVLDPPIPCGTVLSCQFPCVRPPPTCGHPRVPHACHGRVEDRGEEESVEGIHADGEPVDRARPISRCPPCPHLVTKPCACGKKMVPNVRCSTAPDKVRCGGVCGKLMECGFHRCDRGCHPGQCGDCSAPCGKTRRLCLPFHHSCTLPCHAPSACSEAEPCQAIITVSCPCGRIKQAVHCGRNANQPAAASDESSRGNTPKCNSECAIAKRNARLADALGINPQSRAAEKAEVNYGDELVSFAKSDAKFLALVERTFADFVNGEKRNQVLPHMPVERRQFVHDLAALYRIDTQMVDQEPHRSVQLLRRVDTRIPAITLSTHIAANRSTSNLGKLTDMSLRSGSSSWRNTPTITPTTTPHSRAAPVPTTSDASTSVRVWGAASQQALNRASPKPSSGTAPHSRATTPAPPPASTVNEPTTPVPADWEDDV
ncbi:hypothetical protein BDN71DRAFT_1458737 [Pleurotus eryngii]|uniref:R3H domain-containing protein n=1 Tax=Pleurotus eryngii TaxID=5323 RepID=A0A9P6D8W8_PLEER|nr:hypothetical protein BDN71DRAFT_1458737 [Pleurotus eryngii]